MAHNLTRITARTARTTTLRTAATRCLTTTTPSSAPISPWSDVPEGPPDAILGLNTLFAADKDTRKISVGVGAYRGADGKPFVLPSVKEAEKQLLAQNLNREYLPITGLATFNELACDMIYGKDRDIPLAKTQVLSGTGGLRIGGEFLKSFGNVEEIYMPNPTWGNHAAIFKRCGLTPKTYRYLDFDGKRKGGRMRGKRNFKNYFLFFLFDERKTLKLLADVLCGCFFFLLLVLCVSGCVFLSLSSSLWLSLPLSLSLSSPLSSLCLSSFFSPQHTHTYIQNKHLISMV